MSIDFTELTNGVNYATARLKPADPDVIEQTLGKLAVIYGLKLTDQESEILITVWTEANGDIPSDLWIYGATQLAQNHVYGMPKPADLRRTVERRLTGRITQHQRLMKLWDIANEQGASVKPQSPKAETEQERLRATIWLGWKYGRHESAGRAERRLASIEQRQPADWAKIHYVEAKSKAIADTTPLPGPSNWMRASLNRSLAKRSRSEGDTSRAQKLEAEAMELHPFDDDGKPLVVIAPKPRHAPVIDVDHEDDPTPPTQQELT